MGTIERNKVATPVLAREEVPVPSLGGSVIVRGLMLAQHLLLAAARAKADTPRPGESPEQAADRARTHRVSDLLAHAVVLDDGQPLFTAAEWEVFGSRHPHEAITLYNAARRVNGEDTEAAEKN